MFVVCDSMQLDIPQRQMGEINFWRCPYTAMIYAYSTHQMISGMCCFLGLIYTTQNDDLGDDFII